MQDGGGTALRVGIVLPPSALPTWNTWVLEGVQQSSFATINAIFHTSLKHSSSSAIGLLSHVLFRGYERWDASRNPNTAAVLAPAPANLPDDLPVFSLPWNDAPAKLDELRRLKLDVLLCLDPELFPATVGLPKDVARYGVALLDVADTLYRPGVPPVWPEHSQAAPACRTRMLFFSDVSAQPRMLYETQSALNPFSLSQSRAPIYGKAAAVVLRVLQKIACDGASYLKALPAAETSSTAPKRGGLGLTRFLVGELQRRLRARNKRSSRATFAKWCIGLRPRATASFDSPANYRLMVSPRDRFYADPFLFEHDGRTWLFFEDFRYPENKAVISCCELNDNGVPGEPFEVLRLPYHLSYPFIFQQDGVVYMLPESRGNRSVSLFRATDFPRTWQHDTDLFSGVDMVDATLHHADDGTWWVFAGVSNGKYSNSDELCLYFADSFRGPWTPHPLNPVISDVRRARPAGRIFREGNRLIRPSQDCGPAYGYALVFAEIEELTRDTYRERLISTLLPESIPGNTANHTYTRTSGFETIDRFFIESGLSQTDTFSPPPPIP